MKTFSLPKAFPYLLLFILSCNTKADKIADADLRIKTMDSAALTTLTKSIESSVTPQLADGLTLKLWAVDSLVADPVAIDIDDEGRVYYSRTNRQKAAEFDIRGHQDWEIRSIALSDIEEKRAFLRSELSPERSKENLWLPDLNRDSSHDWRDMTVQKEHIYRVEDANGDGIADKSQLVVEDFNDETTDAAGGVMKHGDDLFVAIGPDLWRIKENKAGLMDSKTSLSHGYGIHIGFSGHGMSGVELGPDGRIYWQIGDIGFHGKNINGKDYNHSNSGVIVRSNPDGSDFEVFAYGNRNTHEFVFDEYGNLISEDNDGDHPGESERIVYVVEGADIGWRTNWQFGKYRDPENNTYKVWMDEKMYVPRWEGQPAYILPTIKNYVNGPTGMLYNPGTALGPDYKNHFFVAEFVGTPTGSGIHAFTLKPKGASFEFVETKKVLGNVLATGMDWGPDGSMYVADWIDGWGTKDRGRIWKLDVANPNLEARKNTEKEIRADYSTYKVDALKALLKHDDMRVRQKAQLALTSRGNDGLEAFKTTLADKSNQLSRVHAIWGISQFARKDIKHAALLLPYLKDGDPEIRAQAARWLGDVRYKDAGEQLLPLLKDEYSRARFYAAEALGRIAYAPAIQPIIDMMAANNDVDNYLRHAGSLALARIGNAAPIIALSSHPNKAVRIAAVIALRRLQDPGIKVFLKDADEFVVTEAARAINDDLSIKDALADLGNALNDHRFSNEAFVRRAINANLRVGTDQAMQNLINYISFEGAPAAMRNEAMDALSTWAKPSVLDRVDGRYRGEVKRALEPVQKNSLAVLTQMLGNKDATVRTHAARALGKLKMDAAIAPLMASLKKDASADVRVAAVKSLVQLKGAPVDEVIKTAIADKDKPVRVAGLDELSKADIDKNLMVSLLNDVISNRTPEEKQAALTTLGKLPLSYSEKVLTKLLDQMQAGKLPNAVWLELSDALDATKSSALQTRFTQIMRASSTDSLKAMYAGALNGGDPGRGANIFWSNSSAQCVRCHAIDDYGGNVGPKLNGIASRLKQEQLLEALINPSARIAPGYGKEGTPSSMPQMTLLLNKKEIRDVVAYLATLK